MSRRPLSSADEAFRQRLNEGLACPDGYEALADTEVVECDICHRIIQYWHFHTVVAPVSSASSTLPPPASSSVGSGLDCCNVCRFRFDAAVAAKKGAGPVSLPAVHPNGRGRTVRLSASLRFYCIGMVHSAIRGGVKGAALEFLNKMADHEKAPEKVAAGALFAFTRDCPVAIGAGGVSPPSQPQTNPASSSAPANTAAKAPPPKKGGKRGSGGQEGVVDAPEEGVHPMLAACAEAEATAVAVAAMAKAEEPSAKRGRSEKTLCIAPTPVAVEDVPTAVAVAVSGDVVAEGRGVQPLAKGEVRLEVDAPLPAVDTNASPPLVQAADPPVPSAVVGGSCRRVSSRGGARRGDESVSKRAEEGDGDDARVLTPVVLPVPIAANSTSMPLTATIHDDPMGVDGVDVAAVAGRGPRATPLATFAKSPSKAPPTPVAQAPLPAPVAAVSAERPLLGLDTSASRRSASKRARESQQKGVSKEVPVPPTPIPATPAMNAVHTPTVTLADGSEVMAVAAAANNLLPAASSRSAPSTPSREATASGDGLNPLLPESGECSEALLSFLSALPSGFATPLAPEVDATTTRFIHHDGGDAEGGVSCGSEESIVMGGDAEGTVAGLRAAGVRTLDASWVPMPSPTDAAAADANCAYLCTVGYDEQHANFMTIWKVSFGVAADADVAAGCCVDNARQPLAKARGIQSVRRCYKVALGKKKPPTSIAWMPIPSLFSVEDNRLGICTIARDTMLYTFVLPLNPTDCGGEGEEEGEECVAIAPTVAGLAALPSEVVSLAWAPARCMRSVDDLRLFVQLRCGAVRVLAHRSEEDMTVQQAATKVADPMRMLPEADVPSSGSPAGGGGLAVGSLFGVLHAAWVDNGNAIVMAKAPFNEGGVTRYTPTEGGPVTAIAITDGGLVFANAKGTVSLLKRNGREEVICASIGVDISMLSQAQGFRPQAKRYYAATATHQFFMVRRTSMTTMSSLMELICTPDATDDKGTVADVRTGFEVYHLVSDHTNANNLMAKVKGRNQGVGGDPSSDWLAPADVAWRVRDSISADGQYALGMCGDGTLVIFSCDV